MAETRTSFSYKIYSVASKETEEATLTFSPSEFFTKQTEYKELPRYFAEYDKALNDLIQAINAESKMIDDAQHVYLSLVAFLFPNQPILLEKKIKHADAVAQLYKVVNALANHAIKIRKGGLFGIGANTKAYVAAATLLNQIGTYIENKIISTPWHISIPKENYLLVALKNSPEYFVKMQKNHAVDQYITELNTTKNEHSQLIREDKNSNLVQKVQQYVVKVKNVGVKFQTLRSTYLNQIKTIESKRLTRWNISNYLRDFFHGGEKKQLIELKNQLNIACVLEKSYIQLEEGTQSLKDQNSFVQLSGKLLQSPANLTELELKELREAVINLLKLREFNSKVTSFIQQLQQVVIKAIEHLDTLATPTMLSKQLAFLAQNAVKDTVSLSAAQTAIVEKIKTKVGKFNNPSDGLAYIIKLENLNEAIKSFDMTLYITIQNKKKQYESWKLLSQTWDELLDDNIVYDLSDKKIDAFIAAVLWLEKINIDTSNYLIEELKQLTSADQDQLQQLAKEKITSLKQQILNDINCLSDNPVDGKKLVALKQRFKFINHANTYYTKELGDLRKKIIQAIQNQLNHSMEIQEFKHYLDNLDSVLPEELVNDHNLAAIIKDAKISLVKRHFSEAQHKLHKEYEREINFLKTGKLDIWETIKSKLTGKQPQALTEDNIYYWQNSFLQNYATRLKSQMDSATKFVKFKPENEIVDKKTLCIYLQQCIQDDYKSIAIPLTVDLRELADMRRKSALEKLDKIFGLEVTKSIDINLFMVRYFALSAYQKLNYKNSTLVESGRDFIRQFHDIAQNEGGFTTQIVAKLPIEALNAMYLSWSENPTVSLSVNGDVLQSTNNIIGEVDTTRDSHIQLPRYLLFNMVLELIVADFDALLRGETIDIELLNDRIAFAIPKLGQQIRYESELSGKSGTALRHNLLTILNNINLNAVDDHYTNLVISLLPKGTVNHNKWGFISNLHICEKTLQEQLKNLIKDQISLITGVDAAYLYDQAQVDESMVQEIDEKINLLKNQETKNIVTETITNLERCKKEYTNKITEEKTKAAWLQETQENIGNTLNLLNDDKITLSEFITKMDTKILELLDPDITHACMVMKQDIAFKSLLSDENFKHMLVQLKTDLENDSSNLIDIVRNIPESITRELPSKTADIIRKLQYRFADRFKNLMVKMLDKNNLLLVNDDIETTLLPSMNDLPAEKGYLESWGLPRLSFFQAKKTEDTSYKESARQRLENVLKHIDSDMIKQMLWQLTNVAVASNISLEHLYNIIGVTAPVGITPRN